MAILITIFIIILIISFVKPFFGLLSFMAILYLRPMEFFPELIPFHIAKVVAIVAFLGFLINRKRGTRIFFTFKQDKILFSLLIVILLSFSVGWIPKCLKSFETMLKNVVLYIMIINLVNSKKRLKILIWSLIIMSGILAFNVVQTYRALDPNVLYTVRIGGFSGSLLGGGHFGGPGDFAVMMNIVIPFALFFALSGRPLLMRPPALMFSFLFTLGMLSTHARGGLISFGGAMLGISYFGLKSRGTFKKFISILIVIASIVGMIAFAPSAFKERAMTIADYGHQGTALRRIEYWKLGIKMFLSNPLIGIGAGNYPLRYWDFGGWERQWRVAHNMYIQVLSELGILGFSCLFLLLYFTFKDGSYTEKLLKKKNKTNSFLYIANQGAIVSLFAYCIGGMFENLFTYPMLYILIAILVSIKTITVKSVGRA